MSTAYVDDRQLHEFSTEVENGLRRDNLQKKLEYIWARIQYLRDWDPWLEKQAIRIRKKMAVNRAWSFAIGWSAVGLASIASVTTFTSLLPPWTVGTISALAALVVATGKFIDVNGKNSDLARLEGQVESSRYEIDINEFNAIHSFDYLVSKWPQSKFKNEDDLIKYVEGRIDYINSWYHREYGPTSARYRHLGEEHPVDSWVPSDASDLVGAPPA